MTEKGFEGISVTYEPEIIRMMRNLVTDHDRNKTAITVTTTGPFPQIGINPELLSARVEDDIRVWSVNKRQAAKVLKQWDAEMRDYP